MVFTTGLLLSSSIFAQHIVLSFLLQYCGGTLCRLKANLAAGQFLIITHVPSLS